MSEIEHLLSGEDPTPEGRPDASNSGAPTGDRGGHRESGSDDPDISAAAKVRPGDEKIPESLRSDRQRIGAPGEPRPNVRPVHWLGADPDGAGLRRLTEAVGDDPLRTFNDWAGKLDVNPTNDIAVRTACAERFRAFADIMNGGEPRLAAGDAMGIGEYRAEMWEWLGGSPGSWGHDPALGSADGFTTAMYDSVGRTLHGSPPGTVAYLGVNWTGGGGHAFGGFIDAAGQLRWWDGMARLHDPNAPVTGPWPPPFPRSIEAAEIAVRRPGERWLTPGPDGQLGELHRLADDAQMIDFRYPQPEQPALAGGAAENVEQHGRNEIRSGTPDGDRPGLRVTAREATGTDPRSRHVPWEHVSRLLERDTKINQAAWQRMGDEWDKWIDTGHEIRAEISPSPEGLRVRYSVVDARSGETVWDGGRGIFERSGSAVLRHPDGGFDRFEAAGPVPLVHHGNGNGREDFGTVFPELAEINPERPGLPPTKKLKNCEASVLAAELTLRGEPSSAPLTDANDLTGSQNGRLAIRIGVPHTTFRDVSGFDEIAREIYRAGDGARGVVGGDRTFLGIPMSGHLFMVVNRGGRVCFIDPMRGGWARLERYAGGLELLRTNYGWNENQHGTG